MARHPEFALLILNIGNCSWNRRAVHVYVGDIEENAYPRFARIHVAQGTNFPVRWRYDHIAWWGNPLGIAEEVQAKRSQNIQRHPHPGVQKIGESKPHQREAT